MGQDARFFHVDALKDQGAGSLHVVQDASADTHLEYEPLLDATNDDLRTNDAAWPISSMTAQVTDTTAPWEILTTQLPIRDVQYHSHATGQNGVTRASMYTDHSSSLMFPDMPDALDERQQGRASLSDIPSGSFPERHPYNPHVDDVGDIYEHATTTFAFDSTHDPGKSLATQGPLLPTPIVRSHATLTARPVRPVHDSVWPMQRPWRKHRHPAFTHTPLAGHHSQNTTPSAPLAVSRSSSGSHKPSKSTSTQIPRCLWRRAWPSETVHQCPRTGGCTSKTVMDSYEAASRASSNGIIEARGPRQRRFKRCPYHVMDRSEDECTAQTCRYLAWMWSICDYPCATCTAWKTKCRCQRVPLRRPDLPK